MELLTKAGAATRVHVAPDDDGDWMVWLDTEVAEQDGLCIGVGPDRASALQDAIVELRDRLADLERA